MAAGPRQSLRVSLQRAVCECRGRARFCVFVADATDSFLVFWCVRVFRGPVLRSAVFVNDAMVRLLVLVLGLLGPHWPNAVSANWM